MRFAVLANPIHRCGVRLTAEQHAKILACPLLTEPANAAEFDFIYLHWHPNFELQHPLWVSALRELSVPTALIIHDYLAVPPTQKVFFRAAFNRRAAPSLDVLLRMPLQQPYPFQPRTLPDPDRCGFFGFFHSSKGVWLIAAYAHRHRKRARFITTLHPFAPPWVAAEFAEFKATARRLGFEVIDEWLIDQELADAMGECGFFIVLHKGVFGASASVTSALAAHRPVFASPSPFLHHVKPFVRRFHPERWPSEEELRAAQSLVQQAHQTLDPWRIWNDLHERTLNAFYSRCYN